MKKIIFIMLLAFLSNFSFSQAYLGRITKKINLRDGPGIDYETIGLLKKGAQIFIVSLETTNDFYNVIDISKDKEGYVPRKYVKIGKIIKTNDQDIFTPSGTTTSYNPEVEVYNNTNLTLTLKLNSSTHSFEPQEKRTLTLAPGTISYRASAPGVIPNIGNQYLNSNEDYTWRFYIATDYK
ncbi:MAG: SH3 domain-containing protein [Legionella sp.]|uniref:SH3 domain-containing protein n=1 Tax=Legionella sp. TaxID=459 RepID=UPI0028415064|nr:SH3 domain-containing protein [Legionella sp.]